MEMFESQANPVKNTSIMLMSSKEEKPSVVGTQDQNGEKSNKTSCEPFCQIINFELDTSDILEKVTCKKCTDLKRLSCKDIFKRPAMKAKQVNTKCGQKKLKVMTKLETA